MALDAREIAVDLRERLTAAWWLAVVGGALCVCALAGIAWLLADGVRYVVGRAR